MRTLSSFRSRQAELLQMIEDLQSILTKEHLRIRPNAKTAYELLCDLGGRAIPDEREQLLPRRTPTLVIASHQVPPETRRDYGARSHSDSVARVGRLATGS